MTGCLVESNATGFFVAGGVIVGWLLIVVGMWVDR